MMMNQGSKPAGTVATTWTAYSFDVWGNAKDGWDVNQSWMSGSVVLNIPVTRYNVDTPQEFKSGYPTDRQIKRAFGVSCRIETNGDDIHIDVERLRDGCPIGRLICTSHESLSPIRAVGVKVK
jgi:hypothetical protein